MKKQIKIALMLALAVIMFFTACGKNSETTDETAAPTAEETTAIEETTASEVSVEPYDGLVDYDTYGEGVANWVDDFKKDGAGISGDGEGKQGLVNYNYTFDTGDYGLETITIRGWMGLGGEIAQLGYSFDNGTPVYTDAIEETEDAVKSVAGEYGVRFEMDIDVSELTLGKHTINLVAKLTDGKEIIFNGAYKEPEMKGSLPYNGNIITTINLEVLEKKEIPSSEKGAELCKQAKIVADFCRNNGFTYGDAGINPGINWQDLDESTAINPNQRKFSCDRLVCWALYRMGYTDQPYTQGLVVYAPGGNDLSEYCAKWGFIKITNWADLQPGDIVFVGATRPQHVYIFSSWAGEVGGDVNYRYDGGSDWRIQQVQPYAQSVSVANENFLYAYRPM